MSLEPRPTNKPTPLSSHKEENKDKLSIKQRQKDKPIKRPTFIQIHRHQDKETQKSKGQADKQKHRAL